MFCLVLFISRHVFAVCASVFVFMCVPLSCFPFLWFITCLSMFPQPVMSALSLVFPRSLLSASAPLLHHASCFIVKLLCFHVHSVQSCFPCLVMVIRVSCVPCVSSLPVWQSHNGPLGKINQSGIFLGHQTIILIVTVLERQK